MAKKTQKQLDAEIANALEKVKAGPKPGANWIAGAIKKKGALRKQLGIPNGKTIPASKLKKAAKKPGKLGKRARLALTLKKLGKGK